MYSGWYFAMIIFACNLFFVQLKAWGLTSRGVAFCYMLAFVSLYFDLDTLVGSQGLWPAQESLHRIRLDFDSTRRLLYFPSLLWFTGSSDFALRALVVTGVILSLLVILPFELPFKTNWLFLGMFAIFGSFTVADGLLLWFPWDGMLLEAGALCSLLPPLSQSRVPKLHPPNCCCSSVSMAPFSCSLWIWKTQIRRQFLDRCHNIHSLLSAVPTCADTPRLGARWTNSRFCVCQWSWYPCVF